MLVRIRGYNLADARRSKGLTLGQVAAAKGISTGWSR